MIEYSIIKPKVNKNGTCVESQHCLMESLICLNKDIIIYHVRNKGSIRDAVTVTDANGKQFGIFEVILNITQAITIMKQYEEQYVSSYGHNVHLIS